MKRWKLYAGLIVIFLSGIVVGTVGTGIVVARKFTALYEEGPEAVHRATMRRLTQQLGLTGEQGTAISSIVRKNQLESLRLRHTIYEKQIALIETNIEKARAHLTPDQNKKLDTLRDRWMRIAAVWGSAMEEAAASGATSP